MANMKRSKTSKPNHVASAINMVRDAVANASKLVLPNEYNAFLEKLLEDAQGWRMELEERELNGE